MHNLSRFIYDPLKFLTKWHLIDNIFQHLKKLFPNKFVAFIFVLYMILFINQGLLITSTKSSTNKYHYNPSLIVLLTEYVKLLASIALYLKNESLRKFFSECIQHRKVFVKYFIPAFLYCLYNNLQFVNLAAYDPTTYFILLQFRVVVTGIIYQILFDKKLTRKQWISLFILTLGCIVKQAHHPKASSTSSTTKSLANSPSTSLNFFPTDGSNSVTVHERLSFYQRFEFLTAVWLVINAIRFDKHLLYILIQILCSCFAGVYNEFLLKNKSGSKKPDHITPNNKPNGQMSNSRIGNGLKLENENDETHLMIENFREDNSMNDSDIQQKSLAQSSPEVVPIMIQNVYMYLDSIICNYFYMSSAFFFIRMPKSAPSILLPSIDSAHASQLQTPMNGVKNWDKEGILATLTSDYRLTLIILNGAAIGIVTSIFLKHLNSILKNFASALEIIFTAVLAKILLGIPAGGMYTVTATLLVFYSIWLYSSSPL